MIYVTGFRAQIKAEIWHRIPGHLGVTTLFAHNVKRYWMGRKAGGSDPGMKWGLQKCGRSLAIGAANSVLCCRNPGAIYGRIPAPQFGAELID